MNQIKVKYSGSDGWEDLFVSGSHFQEIMSQGVVNGRRITHLRKVDPPPQIEEYDFKKRIWIRVGGYSQAQPKLEKYDGWKPARM